MANPPQPPKPKRQRISWSEADVMELTQIVMDEVTDNIFPPLSSCQANKSSNHYQSEVFFH